MRSHVRVSTHVQNPWMSGDTCEKSPVPSSLSTVQSHMPNRNFVVSTATLTTVTFYIHSSALPCFVQNEKFDVLQQKDSVLQIGKSWIARAVPNKQEQSLMQTKVHVRIDARAPLSFRHALLHGFSQETNFLPSTWMFRQIEPQMFLNCFSNS